MELSAAPIQEKVKETKEKILRLTYKEKIALEELPKIIEKLELEIQEKNNCLANPSCYEEIGINKLAQELENLESEYELKMEELFEIEEKEELINTNK